METQAFIRTEYQRWADEPVDVSDSAALLCVIPKRTRFLRIDPSVDVYIEVATNAAPPDPMTGSMRILANVPYELMLNEGEHNQVKILGSGDGTVSLTLMR